MSSVGSLSHRIGYSVTAFLARLLFFVISRPRFVYFHAPPRDGAFILASNHISHFDPPLLGAHFPRPVDWLAMRELFTRKWSASFLTVLDCIEVDRTGEDRSALRTALKRLKDGRVVGVFPEGGLRDGAQSVLSGAPFRAGVSLLAAHSGAPIVPAVILGTDRLYNVKNILPWRRASIWVGVGAPIAPRTDLPRDEARAQLTADLAAAWLSLRDRLVAHFSLTEADLPHSPQQRMAER